MPAAGSFRPGPSKGKAINYSDFYKGTTRPAVTPKAGGVDTGSNSPVRRNPYTKSAGGFSAAPPEKVDRDRGVRPTLESKAEAIRRRLGKGSRLKKNASKLTAAMKAKKKG